MAILAECPVCRKKQSNKNRLCTCGEDLIKAKRSKRVRFWITYRLPGGKQRREAIGFSVEEARAAEGKRKAQKFENPRILEKVPEERMTFRELSDWYLDLPRVKRLRSFWRIRTNLESFSAVLGERIVKAIKTGDLEQYQALRKAAGLSDAYVDQELCVAGTVVNKAFDNDLVSGETVKSFRRVKKLLKTNANARDRILSPEEYARLMEHLPPHARPIIATAYFTGMRSGEIFSLTWDKVDLKNRIIRLGAEDTKDREPRTVPVCEELYEILSALPRSIRDNHVFLYQGQPVKKLRRSLQSACELAGIPFGRKAKGGFTFHDLRHTFNTNMRRAGVPESVIMKMTGHSTRAMFDRYNTVDLDDAQDAVRKMSSFLQCVDQNVDHK